MKYNIDKLRSWGMRYLASDRDGQVWAYEDIPVRSENHTGYWRIADKFLPPKETKKQMYHYGYYARTNRKVCIPISNCPIKIEWHDEPYDMVSGGLISICELKVWGEPPHL